MAEKKVKAARLFHFGCGVLDHQISGGTGKTLATVAGAAGGACAGKKVEEKSNIRNV